VLAKGRVPSAQLRPQPEHSELLRRPGGGRQTKELVCKAALFDELLVRALTKPDRGALAHERSEREEWQGAERRIDGGEDDDHPNGPH
jgi:hypothetical protein